MLEELPGVEEVLPDGVEAAGDGSDGGEVVVAEPDEEAGVLLPEGLAGGDGRLAARRPVSLASTGGAAADAAAGEELEGAGGHGHEDNQRDGPSAETAHDQRAGRQDHGEGEAEEPDIEGIAAPSHQHALEPAGGVADGPGEESR